ncbi:MAG: hypothetical protein E8G75_06950, partial [Sulfitobacter sp. SK025]
MNLFGARREFRRNRRQLSDASPSLSLPAPAGALWLGAKRKEHFMDNDLFNSFMTGPDENGRFGDFGGAF